MASRTGIAVLTVAVKGICRTLTTYRTHIDDVIATAVTAGTITSGQATTVASFLDLAQAACNILRLVSGY